MRGLWTADQCRVEVAVQDIVYSFVSTFDRHRDELYPEMFADGAHGGIGPGAEYTDFDFSAVLGSCNQILKLVIG